MLRMSFLLFADAETPGLLRENWPVLLPVVLGFAAIYLLLPQGSRRMPIWAGALAGFAVILGAAFLVRNETVWPETLLFYAFAGSAIGSGVMMITQKNPVHSALSFALVVLSTCGLFLLQAAPFLMAATIIIYAGAIVVTFLFVIMLAHQEGPSSADQRSREPFLASLAGGVLLASLLCVLHKGHDTREIDGVLVDLKRISAAKDEAEVRLLLGDPKQAEFGKLTRPIVEKLRAQFTGKDDDAARNEIEELQKAWNGMHVELLKKRAGSLLVAAERRRQEHGSLALRDVPGKKGTPGHWADPGQLPAANVAALGRTLFTDYLIPVELAATLLLVATIGAILIAGRKSEELR
jgi:NADH-quinone oxidoreductase subunit J